MMDQNQLTVRTYMAIMAERDAAIQERNMCLEERKRAFAERDMAMLQRDAAIAERNSAMQERDEAVTALRLLESSVKEKFMAPDTTNLAQYDDIHQQMHLISTEAAAYDADSFDFTEEKVMAPRTAKAKVRKLKEHKLAKPSKSPKTAERPRTMVRPDTLSDRDRDSGDRSEEEQDQYFEMGKDNLELDGITFDDSVMPTPVCTCTGSPQPCYRWGNGGWQSACCTTTISMYPLPQVSNKRYTRVGGRKMSGSAFSKLLNRLASEGHDLSNPLDLKDHWAKHGTNRYTSVK